MYIYVYLWGREMKRKLTEILTFTISFIILFTSISPMLAFSVSAKELPPIANHSIITYNTQSGLPDDMVYDIATTPDGYLWFATASGLVRYDGKNYVTYNKYTDEQFDAVSVRRLFVDRDGKLWIGTESSGVFCKDDNGFTHYKRNKSTSSVAAIKDFAQIKNGGIVVATANGLFLINTDGSVETFENSENTFVQARTITVNSKTDEITCATETGKVITAKDGKIESIQNYKDSEGGAITSICHYKDNIYKLGTSLGLIVEIDTSKDVPVISRTKTSLSSINQIYLLDDGSMLIAGADGAGYLNAKNEYFEDTYLHGKNVNAVCVDFEGNYWHAVEGEGVAQLVRSAFYNVTQDCSLKTGLVNCVIEFEDNTYIGTNNGLYAINEKATEIITNDLTKALEGMKINDMSISLEGRLIVATDADGVYAFGGRKGLKHYTQEGHLLSNHVNTICVMDDYLVALGYDDGISLDINQETIAKFDENNGIAGNVIKLYKSKLSDGVLIGTESNGGYGLNEKNEIVSLNNGSNLEGSRIKAMLDSTDLDGMWVGSGSSLFYCDAQGNRTLIDKIKLTHSIIDLFIDPNGKLWIITSDRIVVADEKNLLDSSQELKADIINKNAGLVNDLNPSAYNYMSDDGMLYLCTNSGVMKLDTTNYKLDRQAPKLAIDYVLADGKDVIVKNNKISLESTVEKLDIDVSIISFIPELDYKLMYKLENAENYLTANLSQDNEIVYTNLAGGEHTIEIILTDGQTEEELSSISVNVSKEYSVGEIKAFRAFCIVVAVLLIAPIVYLFLSYRIYRNKKKRERAMAIAEQSMHSFAKTIDAKDPYTKGHSERVAQYSVEIARRYGLSDDRLNDLYYAALLHDIGKIGIPDSILKKPSKFTDEEYEIMKSHTTVGAEILEDIQVIKNIKFGARDHHEKYDGTGYPRGISGTLISFEGRVIGAADAYDAMTTLRGYNETMTHEEIKKEFIEKSGTHFDPKIAEIVIQMIDDDFFDPPEENPNKKIVEKVYKRRGKKRKNRNKSDKA